jgi:murein DD-endopeptidase / murein LD-carboxypeptidase
MLKYLRIVFILVLMICFLASCRHRRQESQAVLKTATRPPVKKARTTSPSSSPDRASQLKEALGLTNKDLQGKLYSFVLDWYGVPYRYGGCQKNGVDCSCFASLLCQSVYGYSLPRQAGEIFKGCKQLGLEDVREGDLLFFKIGSTKITHVAVYLRNRYFVHASTSRGVMVNSLGEAYFKKYFFSAGRMKAA